MAQLPRCPRISVFDDALALLQQLEKCALSESVHLLKGILDGLATFRRSFRPQFRKMRDREKALSDLRHYRGFFATLSGEPRFRDYAREMLPRASSQADLDAIVTHFQSELGIDPTGDIRSVRMECARVCYRFSEIIKATQEVPLLGVGEVK